MKGADELIRSFREIDIRSILIIFAVVLVAVFLGKNICFAPPTRLLFLVLGLVVVGAVLINTDVGIFIIIFSMLLSPELKIGVVPGQDVVLRLEDVLLLIVTLTWLVKTAINKELGLFRRSPLNGPIGIYILCCILFTLRGILIGRVNFSKGFFFVLKYIEYSILYFMVLSQVRNRDKIRTFVIAFLVTCAITCLYADLQIGKGIRVSAPFEGEAGEPNTLGGYLVFMFMIIMGIILYAASPKVKFWLGVLVLFLVIPAFLFTLSRTAYLAMIPAWICLIVFAPRKLLLTTILLWVIALSPIAMPQVVRERIKETVSGSEIREGSIENVVIGGVELDPSSSARIISWQYVIRDWSKRPFFGYGLTGVGFIDGQYVRTLGELGLVGLGAFLFLLWSIFKHTKQIYLKVEDKFFKGLSLGFLAGFVGLLFFNGGANGFVLTRIMEPFWFMAAIVMVLPEIEEQESKGGLQQI